MNNPEPKPRAALLVAANRGPLTVAAVDDDGDDEIRRGSGGLVSGMQAALSATPDAVWVCAAMNDRERSLARLAPSGRLSEVEVVAAALGGDFDVRMLPIDALTFRNAYNGIANSTLWFVLHMLYAPAHAPVFGGVWRRQWASYVRYNQAFAQALAEEAASDAKVMIQDYHLLLAPRMLRTMRPDLRIAHFTHTPWVSPETFAMLPDDVAYAICDGMLGADLIGFHTDRWADLFRATCRAMVGRAPEGVAAFPLGINAAELRERAGRRDVDNAVARLNAEVGERLVVGRIDRAELSKNVWRGLLAFRDLLRTRPEWHDRVVHVVWDQASREDLPEYREYSASMERLAAEINDEFGTEDWTPVLLTIAEDYPSALATLRRSDVLFVNSLRDGMNLVALEGLVVSDRDPALVLSREAGAADILGQDAILVNPFDTTAMAEALQAALTSSPAERRERVERMRAAATKLPPDKWFRAQLDALG